MPRQWKFVVDEVHAFDRDLGTFVSGQDRGDLIESGDQGELVGRAGTISATHVGFHGQAVGHVRLTLQGVTPEQVAVGDGVAGHGESPPAGRGARGPADGPPVVPVSTEELERMAWDAARADAGRGSSGHWTAGFEYLPLSFGGASTEAEAMQGLRRKLRESLGVDTERASALRLVMRWQGHDPQDDSTPSQ